MPVITASSLTSSSVPQPSSCARAPKACAISAPASRRPTHSSSCKDDPRDYRPANPLLPRGAGSIVSFGIKGGRAAGRKFIESLRMISHLANVGDAKTLVIHPASTTHQQMDAAQLKAAGIGEELVRLSVGIEAASDILGDLAQALRPSQKSSAMRLLVNGIDTFATTGGRHPDPTLPFVVFLHGAGLDHCVWALLSRWFAHHGWNVLAPDLPGHGRSRG